MKFKHVITFLLFSLTLSGCQISKSYTITWENYDGTVLETDSVAYGTTPTYDGAIPTKSGDAQYSYAFSGWSPTVTSVTSNATYTAQFTSSTNAYTITWKNYDGTTLEVDEKVPYGTTPTYDGTSPTRPSTVQNSYIFSNWSPSIVPVTGIQTYVAHYTSSINSFTVTWLNYDNSILEVDEGVMYGTTPTYDGEDPIKPEIGSHTYSFDGWSPEIRIVEENITYVARYNSNAKNPNEFLLYDEYDDYVIITGLSSTNYTIFHLPDSINGKPVTSIGDSAFRDCSSLTSITIPNSVTSIGDSAFYNCASLTSVTIPNSLISIGSYAFFECPSLQFNEYDNAYYLGNEANPYLVLFKAKNLSIENCAINADTKFIIYFAFMGCSSITSITIPNGVTLIGEGAFAWCSNLTSITIPDSVNTIDYDAFYDCPNLQYNEYDNAYYLGNETNPYFVLIAAKNTSIENCVINEDTKFIHTKAFRGCTSLTSITIPNSVTSIGVWAFSNCSSLISITIPNSVTSIGYGAFEYCSNLTSIIIPNSVTSIGYGAFEYCYNLASVTLGNSVTSIGRGAFDSCTSLTSIIIPNSVTSIGDYAFEHCSNLASVTLGNNVNSIGRYAFYECTSLTSIVIPNSVTSIGDSAFSSTSLTSIVIPNSVVYIGYAAFGDCTSLTIYAEANSKPSRWDSSWNPENRPVVWGYKG